GRTQGAVTLKLEHKSEQIDKELIIDVRRAPVRPLPFIVVGALVFIAGLALDRIIDPKGRTYLGTAAAISLTFAIYFGFDVATPHHVMSPAIGAVIVAVIGGGIGGWLISWFVKKMTPERKRRAR